VPRFYKGVGVGTFFHGTDLRISGLSARSPAASYTVNVAMQHIARATTNSPCISLSRSYGVAEMYARDASRAFPTSANPDFVYEVDIPDPPPRGVTVVDPVIEVAAQNANPLISISYHHDGDMNFLLGVANPIGMSAHLTAPAKQPGGSGGAPRAPKLTIELETLCVPCETLKFWCLVPCLPHVLLTGIMCTDGEKSHGGT
jgi:hypothetical protein